MTLRTDIKHDTQGHASPVRLINRWCKVAPPHNCNWAQVVILLNFIVLILIGMVVIFINWPQIPQNLSFDEVEFAKLALSLQNRSFTIYSNLATGHSTLYFYILLASMKIERTVAGGQITEDRK